MKNFEILRNKLVETIRDKGIRNPKVLNAIGKIPRHLFVDEALSNDSYNDNALPIGNGQTISQPFIVALMTETLDIQPEDKILEIGTGSGYQTAVLAEFSRKVYSIEVDRELGERARKRLREMKYENVFFKIGDGSLGWIANAPYNKIIVTAGAKDIPESLLKQLADNGRMVIPQGDRSVQNLLVIDRQGEKFTRRNLGDVVFVPLVGKEGW
jgi:protein-L-isoaspartate(D-aspartate) O-methyltransferase